jgi:hypothetical protein
MHFGQSFIWLKPLSQTPTNLFDKESVDYCLKNYPRLLGRILVKTRTLNNKRGVAGLQIETKLPGGLQASQAVVEKSPLPKWQS